MDVTGLHLEEKIFDFVSFQLKPAIELAATWPPAPRRDNAKIPGAIFFGPPGTSLETDSFREDGRAYVEDRLSSRKTPQLWLMPGSCLWQ